MGIWSTRLRIVDFSYRKAGLAIWHLVSALEKVQLQSENEEILVGLALEVGDNSVCMRFSMRAT
ncbi:hypothetical protein TH63_13630 [Rufibacter radiotolerans]|uniref:Uncharacterized protein n=1 Tax=Rufibacter radiotolerans TaxID=1379910 RepID=A0A0H4VRL7_9BACT|nr:hypothetical protein TH63_13630 [Rufibacter radiotolerans]